MNTRKISRILGIGTMSLLLTMLSYFGYSQACSGSLVAVTLQNVTQPTAGSIQFDVYIKNTGTTSLLMASLGGGVNLVPTGGGTLTQMMNGATAGTITIVQQPNIAGGSFTTLNALATTNFQNVAAQKQVRWTHNAASIGNSVALSPNVDYLFCKLRFTLTGANFPSNFPINLVVSPSTANAGTNTIATTYCNGNTNSAGLAQSTVPATMSAFSQAIILNAPAGSTGVMSGNATVCAGSSSNISVAITGGTSPYTLVYGDGTNSYTVNSYASGSAISVTPSATSTYTVTSVQATGAPTATTSGHTGSATVTVNQPSPSLVTGSVMNTQNQLDGTTMIYKNSCDLIGKIVDAAGGNTLGATSMTSALAATNFVGGLYGFTYCKRTFVATPTSNGAGVVTLYMAPSDFTDFNANKPSWMTALPITPADANLANVRVTRESGGVYTNVFLAASSFTWNALGYWELQVNVPSVGGNYLVTSTPDCTNEEVTGLTATAQSGNTVLVSWAPITGYGWFQIQRRTTNPQGAWIPSGSTTTTSALIGGLVYGTSYDFRVVRLCSPISLGNWTSPVTAATNALPCSFAPNNLTVPTVGITTATATWNAVAGYGYYGVRYRKDSATAVMNGQPVPGWINFTSPTTSGAMYALTGNTMYEVQVKTFCTNANAGVSSAWSATTQFTTMPAPPTPCTLAPTGLAMSAITATTATATWNAVAGFGWYGFKYRAQNLTTPNAWISSTTTGPSKMMTGLVSGTTYEVSVKVFCNNLNPGISSPWSDTTFNFTAGGQTKLSASVASNEVSVYPNPTSDELNIDVVMDNESMTTVKVMDMSGRVVKQIQANTVIGQNNIKISLAELTAGLYTIQVINNDKLMNVTRVSKN